MRNQLQKLDESEGYRMTDFTTGGERAQVTLEWDKRCLPRCSGCKKAMRINRKSVQCVSDMPLGPVSCVLVKYEAVQGCCKGCGRYETVRALQVVEQRGATLRAMRYVSLLCRWLPVQSVCELVAITPMTAWRYDKYIL